MKLRMKLFSRLLWRVSIFGVLILIGCISAPKPPVAQISLNVQHNINSYTNVSDLIKSEARPVVIRFYELTSVAAFNSTDFFSIFNDYKTVLDGELLNSEEFRLTPGMNQNFSRTLHINTRYIGVIAAFRDLEHSQWQAFAAIPAKESMPEIQISLDGNKVSVEVKKNCIFFC